MHSPHNNRTTSDTEAIVHETHEGHYDEIQASADKALDRRVKKEIRVKCKEQRIRTINVGTGDEQEVVVSGRRRSRRLVHTLMIGNPEDRDSRPQKLIAKGHRPCLHTRSDAAFRPIRKKQQKKMNRENGRGFDSLFNPE